jgi:hypothetical protein
VRLPAATALAGLALVTACSGSSTPTVLPTLSPTPSTSDSPVAVPSDATAHTAFGAARFVRFYYAQFNAALNAADVRPLLGLSDPQCGTCKRYLASVNDLIREGQRLQGVAIRILSAEAPPAQNGYVGVDVFLDAPARALVDSTGKVVKRLPASARAHKTVYVKQVEDGWVIRAVQDAK